MSWMLASLGLALLLATPLRAEEQSGDAGFDRRVAPILARSCLGCHSGIGPKGGLDLSSRSGTLKGGENGASVVPGRPNDSLLWDYVNSGEMPPKTPLPESERAILKEWIAGGATWGTDPIDLFRITTATRAGYDWWSLQPIESPVAPSTEQADWSRNPIDGFVLARLTKHELTPSPPADRRTLIRRLSFDLIGLPPSPDDVQAFVGDESPDAYERLVDRLLASPHYGERWARHWLDVAHFGESDGFEFDRMRPNAWPYRDWVVAALNDDMPYDEFARLQIAGDVLRPSDPQALAATGFLVGGAHDGLVPAGEIMRQVMRQDELEDLTALVGQTFLGLTVQCARCHDHKFDPVRQADYYRLAAALAGVHRGERPTANPADIQQVEIALAERQRELDALDQSARDRVIAKRRAGELATPQGPAAAASWDFREGVNDLTGTLDGTLHGAAKLDDHGLRLDGQTAYMTTPPLEQELKAKTLEVWVTLADLAQRGGGVIGVQTLDGARFDTIVFGERDPKQWMAGSDFYRRTQSFQAPVEAEADRNPVHIAIVYGADGTVTGYRNGQPYGKPYRTDVQTFPAGKSQLVFGLRHGPAGNGKLLNGTIQRARLYDRALSADEIALSAGMAADVVSETERLAELTPEQRQRHETLRAKIAEHQSQLQRLQAQKVFAVTPKVPPVTHLLLRGHPAQPGDVIAPAALSVLSGLPTEFALPPDAADAERRTALARWISDPRNPLFARTIVNRLWHYHFGAGLIETPSDLGFSGGPPSHPELLDWLAAELVANGFRLKPLHRAIVLSATYRQSSRPNETAARVDAGNRLLWRYSPRRLDAESLRDAVLAVTGQLNAQMQGPSYQDFRPFVRGNTQFYEPIDPIGPAFHRRTLYRMGTRGGHNPLLDTFDCPDPSTMTPRRSATNTPLQALSLMNNSFVLRMSDRLAERLQREAPDSLDDQIALAFALMDGRAPDAQERALAREFIEQHGLPAFCRVLFNTNGLLYVR